MIKFTQGNLLEADAEALVNTVNTVGVMGKGVALMFKEAFPDNFKAATVALQCLGRRVTSKSETRSLSRSVPAAPFHVAPAAH